MSSSRLVCSPRRVRKLLRCVLPTPPARACRVRAGTPARSVRRPDRMRWQTRACRSVSPQQRTCGAYVDVQRPGCAADELEQLQHCGRRARRSRGLGHVRGERCLQSFHSDSIASIALLARVWIAERSTLAMPANSSRDSYCFPLWGAPGGGSRAPVVPLPLWHALERSPRGAMPPHRVMGPSSAWASSPLWRAETALQPAALSSLATSCSRCSCTALALWPLRRRVGCAWAGTRSLSRGTAGAPAPPLPPAAAAAAAAAAACLYLLVLAPGVHGPSARSSRFRSTSRIVHTRWRSAALSRQVSERLRFS